MANTIRFTGLASGLDTESVVKAIMTPYQSKIDTINKNKVLAEWRKDAYKEMSTKIQNFRTNAINKLKYTSALNKSTATLSQSGFINVDTTTFSGSGTHKISVEKVASGVNVRAGTIKSEAGPKLTKDSKVTDIAGMASVGITDFTISVNGTSKTYNFNGKTIGELETMVKADFGDDINFSFDTSVGAFIINSKETGVNQSIDLSGTDANVLNSMGIKLGTMGYKYTGTNAKIIYNNSVTVESETNAIEVNGLKFTALAETSTPVTVTVAKDIDSMVDTIKNFVTEYNSLLDEINTKLSADSAKGYSPLTEDEKESMTDKEVELWENKIKGALLRNDSTLKDINSMLRETITTDYSKNGSGLDSSCSMLYQLGISSSAWTDKGKLTIDEKKLRAALETNSDGAINLLSTIANKIDASLVEGSSTTELRSYGQYFNDKIETEKISKYSKDVITAQSKYDKLENMYYKKFTAMEQAMSKMNSQSSLFSSL